MAADVLSKEIPSAEEKAWTEEQIAALEKTEAQLVSRWKLHRALRDDSAMELVHEDIKKVRAGLEYLRQSLIDLNKGGLK